MKHNLDTPIEKFLSTIKFDCSYKLIMKADGWKELKIKTIKDLTEKFYREIKCLFRSDSNATSALSNALLKLGVFFKLEPRDAFSLLSNQSKNHYRLLSDYFEELNIDIPKEMYSKEFLKNIILQSAEFSCCYAKHIGKRWKEAEEIIKKDPEIACRYAATVIKGRWIEGEEKAILSDWSISLMYLDYFIKDRWEELEKNILSQKQNGSKILKYCKTINKRWPEAEHLLSHKQKVEYYTFFNISLPEEVYNKELMETAINKKQSKYFNKIKQQKEVVIENLRNLLSMNIISKNDTVEKIISGF